MSRPSWFFAIGILALGVAGHSAWAVESGDLEKGLSLAEEVCANCHAIEKGDDVSPKALAPTFETIASTPGMTPTALGLFLRTPHETMPNLVLSPDELADIIAYILSLKQ
jgi:mono/diheme cytochrome c family protein